MRGAGLIAALGGAGLLAGCAGGQADLAKQCLREVHPYGTYNYQHGVAVPVVTPGMTGSQPEANMINACIQRRAKQQGLVPAAPGATPAVAQKAAPGKLPLPSQYPLMPGDAELWPTLTLAQQERAMVFLKSGATIRSSLEPNQ